MRYIPLMILFLFASCSLLDTDDVTPTFLNIDQVTIASQVGQGSTSHKIEDLWVAVDGNLVGLYQIPSLIPVLKTSANPTELTFFGGIRRNGTNTDGIQYPFLEQITRSVELVEGETLDLDLEFNYRNDATFAFVESFDNSNNFVFDEDENPLTTFGTTDQGAFEGLRSGYGVVTADQSLLEVATDASFPDLPKNGGDFYLEMDYRSNLTLNVGLIGALGQTPLKSYFLFLRPTGEEWNKIYVELTSEIVRSNLDSYKLVFGIEYNADDTGGQDGYLYLDNVKLIHF